MLDIKKNSDILQRTSATKRSSVLRQYAWRRLQGAVQRHIARENAALAPIVLLLYPRGSIADGVLLIPCMIHGSKLFRLPKKVMVEALVSASPRIVICACRVAEPVNISIGQRGSNEQRIVATLRSGAGLSRTHVAKSAPEQQDYKRYAGQRWLHMRGQKPAMSAHFPPDIQRNRIGGDE